MGDSLSTRLAICLIELIYRVVKGLSDVQFGPLLLTNGTINKRFSRKKVGGISVTP